MILAFLFPIAVSVIRLLDNYEGTEHCRYCGDSGQLVVARRRDPIMRKERVAIEHDDEGTPTRFATRLVQVGETELVDELGPCPYCKRGHRLEFGFGKRTVLKGTREVVEDYRAERPPWGKDGYWRGVEPVGLEPQCECAKCKPPLPDEDARHAARAAYATFTEAVDERKATLDA